ncbi:MAG: cupredoxin domain-containing protein [Patescibacteria group bacterium]
MSNKIVSILIIVILIVGGIFLFKNKSSAPTDIEENVVIDETPIQDEVIIREFTIEAKKFSFTPSEIKVKKGETVKITLKNVEGVHNWKLDEFSAGTKNLQAGQEETIEFVADKTGEFEYHCSVGNHRQLGMVGTLTVEE